MIAQLDTSIPPKFATLRSKSTRRSERDFASEGERTPSSVKPPCNYLAVSRFASYYFRCHVLDGAAEGVGPFLLQPRERENRDMSLLQTQNHAVTAAGTEGTPRTSSCRNSLLRPKSVKTTWPSLSRRMFSNLMSRYTIPSWRRKKHTQLLSIQCADVLL